MTSHAAAAQVKTYFSGTSVNKVGHGGTLDPAVTGILPLTLNEANLVQEIILSATKEYHAKMHLHGDISATRIHEVMMLFKGKIYQRPPDRSAVERKLRIREIFEIEITNIAERDVFFRVICDAGTYIRKLCVDIGEVLGCGAHMTGLRRTRSGQFTENDHPVTLAQIENAIQEWKINHNPLPLTNMIHPIERIFTSFPKVVVLDKSVEYICRGQPVRAQDLVYIGKNVKKGMEVGIYTLKGEIIALGYTYADASDMLEARSGHMIETQKIYMNPNP